MTVVALSLATAARAVAIETSAPQHRGNRAVRHGPCGPSGARGCDFQDSQVSGWGCPANDAPRGSQWPVFRDADTQSASVWAGRRFRHRWTDVGFGP